MPDAVKEVFFSTTGAGTLVGVGNGNPHNIDSFQQPHRFTWHGKALAILRPDTRPGTLRLVATADGLDSAELLLRVHR